MIRGIVADEPQHVDRLLRLGHERNGRGDALAPCTAFAGRFAECVPVAARVLECGLQFGGDLPPEQHLGLEAGHEATGQWDLSWANVGAGKTRYAQPDGLAFEHRVEVTGAHCCDQRLRREVHRESVGADAAAHPALETELQLFATRHSLHNPIVERTLDCGCRGHGSTPAKHMA